MNPLPRRARTLHTAEVERWDAAWDGIWLAAFARLPANAAGWADAFGAATAEERAAVEAVLARWNEEGGETESRAAWRAWWEEVGWLWDLDAPDLARWPASLPAPPPEPEGEWEEAAALADNPRGCGFTTPEGSAAAYWLLCIALSREARGE